MIFLSPCTSFDPRPPPLAAAYFCGLLDCGYAGFLLTMQGLKPEALAGILENWDATRAPKPKILHTIPNGSNPSGGSLSEARRRALYATARAHECLSSKMILTTFLNMPQDLSGSRRSWPWMLTAASFVSTLYPRCCLRATSPHASGLAQAVLVELLDDWITAHPTRTLEGGSSTQCQGRVVGGSCSCCDYAFTR